MANLLPFYTMSILAAARFRDATAGRANILEPRRVDAGPHLGKYVLPERASRDPAHADLLTAFAVLTVEVLDTEVAWPATGIE